MRLLILVIPLLVYCGKTVYYHDPVPVATQTSSAEPPLKVEVVIRSPNEVNVPTQTTVHPTACVTPTSAPTATPTVKPTSVPTVKPTSVPTVKPTATPKVTPTPSNCAGSCHTPRYK
jgi:hypothetical protein